MSKLNKKILILGARGMLGSDMVSTLSSAYDVIAMDIDDVDITEEDDIKRAIGAIKPKIVINCAAYTDVDGCETNRDKAFLINAEGVKNIAYGCKSVKAKLIHFSTDYIFDGTKNGPYIEDDTPNPLNVYGQSKLLGERYIGDILDDFIIIRTQWLFGKNGKNFVSTILRLAQEEDELKIVNDQIGSPTYTVDLASATKALVEKNAVGIFNVTNSGCCSRYEFVAKILELSDINHIKIFPVSSEEYQRPARRPQNSILNCNKFQIFAGMHLPNWESALQVFLESLLGSKILTKR